jgi:poly(3-hydroxybutyrate) depolymerase
MIRVSKVLILAALLAAGITGVARAQADDVTNVPSIDKTVPGQKDQRYFLIGDPKRDAPASGFALLVVLPGGDGSAAFNPFIKRIYANALPEGYLVAQLVAVPSKNQNQIVWPTEKLKDPKQTFTTESFIANVVKDVKKLAKIDDARVFTLSWSSGGPAAYAASMADDTPVKGSFVAMSVFPMVQLQASLAAAKGHRYYLLQSPDDQVTKYFFRDVAAKTLTKAGAKVETADYPGGHGWQGDVFGNIRKGVEWLDKEKDASKK